ncbi:uridine diphosphate-N-acetylglucosamine-binding protein YvcK [Marinobacter hydrocarbonoclasticus]|nr:uridine diphosphate-N-acetylglucosamine-binding protein YvcK [Marinobacter nauticus]
MLVALRSLESNLSAIVATTDNGGSTGRLRQDYGGIAWGDIRHCLESLCSDDSVGRLLLNHRFPDGGSLSGHSLGNLMLLAINDLCVAPGDAVEVLSRFLGVQSRLYPMADAETHLVALSQHGDTVIGEVEVDQMTALPERIWLEPAVTSDPAAIAAIEDAELLVFGPGSIITSVLPSLLIPAIRDAINRSRAPKLLIQNILPENSPIDHLPPERIPLWIEQQAGIRFDGWLNHDERFSRSGRQWYAPVSDQGRHDPEALFKAIDWVWHTWCSDNPGSG